MKKISFYSFGFIVIALIAMACDDLMNITISRKETVNFEIGPIPQAGEHVFIETTFQNKLDSILQSKGITKDDLKSIKVENVSVETVESGVNFNPIQSVQMLLRADMMDEISIASFTNTIPNADSISLNVISDDLTNYLGFQTYTVKIKGTNSQPIINPIKAKATIKFSITANISKDENNNE